MKKLLLKKLKEPSTWAGLSLLLTAAGVAIDPVTLQNIGMGIVGLVGLYETVRAE